MRPYLKFLSELANHNSKEWMDANKKWYLECRGEFLEDVQVILKGLSEWEPAFEVFQPKDCVFRQNRDIRFSANKAPYKVNFAAYFSPKGKKSEGPGYYIHIQPGESFIGGGIWNPMGETLKKIRKEIDYSGAEMEQILAESNFNKTFGELRGDKLKTSPREYEADHPYIELLRMKSFTVMTSLTDTQIDNGQFIQLALKKFKVMRRFQEFLTKAVEEVEDGSGIL